MTKILVSVINDLVTDQRVNRICNSLHNAGYDVKLIGRKLKKSQDVNRNYQTKRLKLIFTRGFLFYAFYNVRLFFYMLFQKADIYLSNDLDTLPANYLLSRLKRKTLVFDSHEYFPEVPELIDRKRVQNFWLKIEEAIIPKLKHCYTVSPSIAELYKEKYGVDFDVVRNLPVKQTFDSFEKFDQKTIIYQGALNVSRGIELLIDAMKYMPDYKLIIAGEGDITRSLKQKVQDSNLDKQIEFLGRIPLEELREITRKAHIGLSLEEDRGLNYRFALPNKLFDYIQAQIPVIVSDLPEMKKIVQDYKVGKVLDERNAEKLAGLIQSCVNEYETTDKFKSQLKLAAEELCWEKEEGKLLNIFESATKL